MDKARETYIKEYLQNVKSLYSKDNKTIKIPTYLFLPLLNGTLSVNFIKVLLSIFYLMDNTGVKTYMGWQDITPKDISRISGVSKINVYKTLTWMESKGIIERKMSKMWHYEAIKINFDVNNWNINCDKGIELYKETLKQNILEKERIASNGK